MSTIAQVPAPTTQASSDAGRQRVHQAPERQDRRLGDESQVQPHAFTNGQVRLILAPEHLETGTTHPG